MSAKAFLGIVPVFWFAGLAIYFYRVNDAMGGIASQQLMPTVIGLGAISLLLGIPLLLKLVRLMTGTSAEAARKRRAADELARNDFDADAVIARYIEKKAAGQANFMVPDSAPRQTFGRKV